MKNIILSLVLLVSLIGCGKKDFTTEYLEKSLAAAQKGDIKESKQWLDNLAKLGDIKMEVVNSYLDKGDVQYKCFLAELLGTIGDSSSQDKLIEVLQREENIDLKIYVIDALGKLRSQKAVPELQKYLAHNLWGVRLMAENAINIITKNPSNLKIQMKKKS